MHCLSRSSKSSKSSLRDLFTQKQVNAMQSASTIIGSHSYHGRMGENTNVEGLIASSQAGRGAERKG